MDRAEGLLATAHFRRLACPLAVWAISCASAAPARADCPSPAAHILRVEHTVEYKAATTGTFVPASANASLCRGDSIRTGERSRATILFVDNTRLVIDQNTEWIVREPEASGRSLIEVIRGAILFFMRQAGDVRTPFVNAAVEGTEFLVRVDGDRTWISVFEGRVVAENIRGKVTLGPDQTAVAVEGQAPRLTVRPDNAVQWVLQVEPILPADSFARLAEVPESERTAPFYVRRAALLLGVGRVTEAEEDLARAAVLEPANGDVYALRAISLVARNERAAALEQAQEAVKRSPKSRAAHLALAAALQADLRLDAARDELRQVVAGQPDDAQAWARLAELQLSLGEIDDARDAAARAVTLTGTVCSGENPDATRARVHAVDGFVKLARLDVAAAIAAFDCAIGADPGEALAYLGSGLAKIRQGHLAEGRKQIETAVALSPDDAILRSYLGKAYFEEKRDTVAAREFERAMEIDPRDPTPWFYRAIQEQTINRPIDALNDFQESIKRNGNRAVYRSRLLLDEDLAARGAKLSRIYRDIGFEQLALVQGWQSIETDPANHSAHRLLADNYLSLPSHQVARDSELLQSQVLQPVNINPVQPRLADNGLNFLDDIGIFSAGFGEYSRLFASNGVRLIADGVLGTQDTGIGNVIASGILNRLSFSAGQFYFKSQGLRENNDAKENISNAFVQADLSQKTSLQFEFRGSDTEQGDRTLLFDPDFVQTTLRSIGHVNAWRVNARQRLSPGATVISTFAYRTLESDFTAGPLAVHDQDHAAVIEVRYIQRWKRANLNAGFGYFDGSGTHELSFGPDVFPAESLDTRHLNSYVYGTWNLPENVVLSAGVSGDSLRDPVIGERRQTNPKFGITWAPTPGTFVRAAAFRVMDRTLISGQTIEPTQVSGFNQFFDDAVGTGSWRYGAAVDQVVWAGGYVGAEYSGRKLTVPAFLPGAGELIEGTFQERLARAYVYSTLGRRLALSIEYQRAHFLDPAGDNPLLLQRSTAHLFPFQIRYFDPHGFFAGARTRYATQNGVFRDREFVLFPGRDDFWTTDLSFGYKLPRRLGQAAVDIRNLFDRRFRFQDVNPTDATIVPARQVYARLSLTF